MVSHMTTVGIPIDDDNSLAHFATRAIENGHPYRAAYGTYYCWQMGHGVELWVQINSDDEIIGVQPHFSGEEAVRVGLTQRIRSQTNHDLDSGFYAWLQASEGTQVPFVFDVPNFMAHNDLQLPAVMPVQVAAFAHSVRAYRDLAEFNLAQHNDELQFDVPSFVPTGLFTRDGEPNPQPAPYAFFTGTVRQHKTFTNPATGLSFLWANVLTLGGRVDVVCNPDVCEGVLQRNSVVKGTFWLSGRLVG
jgi:hypothetical protein